MRWWDHFFGYSIYFVLSLIAFLLTALALFVRYLLNRSIVNKRFSLTISEVIWIWFFLNKQLSLNFRNDLLKYFCQALKKPLNVSSLIKCQWLSLASFHKKLSKITLYPMKKVRHYLTKDTQSKKSVGAIGRFVFIGWTETQLSQKIKSRCLIKNN